MRGNRQQVDELQRRVGAILKGARNAKGQDQGSVAEEIGVSHTTISKAESGERLPALATVENIAREVGADVDTLRQMVIAIQALRPFEKNGTVSAGEIKAAAAWMEEQLERG